MALTIVSTRNATSSVSGYRDDLVEGDLVGLSLSSYVGVTSVLWQLVGRPEGSSAGGAGPEPIFLANANTAAFNVDNDAGAFRLDGTYIVQATINPGSPGQVRVTAALCRLTGLAIPGPGGGVRTLRKLGGFEALEDSSVPTILLGWATVLNRWLEALRGLIEGGGGGGGGSGESFPGPDSVDDASGTEIVLWQWTFDGTVHPAGILEANFVFQAKSPGGVATFKLYFGGDEVERFVAPGGGTEIGTPETSGESNYTPVRISGSFTNPNAIVPVQLTMTSPSGQSAFAKECSGRITP